MFEKLYDAIKETEEREGTPLVLRGIFFNSADGQNGEKGIDAEAIQGGAEIITNEEELHDFLQAVGVTEAEIENDLTSGVTMQEDIKKAMALRDVNQTREVPGDYDQAEREEDLLEHEQIMADSRAESDELMEELAEQEHIAEMDEETYEMMIPVPVYKNKTGLYTAEEIEKNNDYVSLYFPESIIEAYCKDQGLDYPDEFFGQYMVHRTRDLADFARERGFEVSKTLPAEYILHRLDSTDTSLTDYIENHYDEAISVMQGGGSILDLEGVLTMEEKLGRSVSYDQYSNLRFEGARITDRMHDRSANNPFNEKFNESTKKALASIFINEGISSDFMDELEDVGILTEYERKLFSDYLSVFPEKKQDILDAVGLTEDYIQNQESLAEAEDIIKEFHNREYGDQADLSDVSKVEIAEGKGIHIYADLENATISTYADGEKLEEMKFGKLKNMLESDDNKSLKKLSSLSSEELINIHLTDTVIERLEEKKMEKLADRVNDLAHDMYSQKGENIPLLPLDKKEMVSALKSGKVEDITTSLVAMSGFVDNNARLEVFNEVRNYSEKEINLLTGLEVSEELNNVMARLAEGEHVSLEEIMTTPEMQQAENRRKAAPEKVTHSDEEIYKAVEKLSAYGSATIDKDGKVSYTGRVDKESRLDIVIGLPASGKSSAIVDDISKEFHSKVLDNDEAKKMFKEFNNGWGASAVHEDSRFVEQVAFERALKNHENIVLPKVGSNADDLVDAYINLAKKEGYKVNIHYVDLEREKALGRMIHRFINQGRYLEPRLIDKYNNEKVGNLVEQAYTKFKTDPEYSKKIDGISRWNNDVNKGEKPILVEAENLSGHYIENARTEEKGGTEHGKAEHGNRGNEQDGRMGSGGQGGSGSRESNDGNGHEQYDNNGADKETAAVLRGRTEQVGVSGEKEGQQKEPTISKMSLIITGATLLSKEEYEASRDNIPPLQKNWWLRSPGINYDFSKSVIGDGVNGSIGSLVRSAGSINDSPVSLCMSVRPALEISNLESANKGIGDKIEFGEHTFTIINDHQALCDDFIGNRSFRENTNSNNYEKSDVKKFVENWFEKQKEIEKQKTSEVSAEKEDQPAPSTDDKITVSFSPKLVGEPFQAKKDGNVYVRVLIPNEDKTDKSPWGSIVVKPEQITDNKVTGKKDIDFKGTGTVTIIKSEPVPISNGKPEFIQNKIKISVNELKERINPAPKQSIKQMLNKNQQRSNELHKDSGKEQNQNKVMTSNNKGIDD